MDEWVRLCFWICFSDNAKLRDLQRRLEEANATLKTSGAAPWLEDRGSRPWVNRLPPALRLVVLVVGHDQCQPLIDLRMAIEADVIALCGSRREKQ